ncbi:MaoC/PaaZ C-terminal domain-containing protein [Ramlibacter sp. AN1015]|uniref:MaoC/PaaZ C-terminal domain-containing protein n=1 Tax=Ramlibacter sp. AN1015 TaxID=3133428 RepID=UPI0030C35C39
MGLGADPTDERQLNFVYEKCLKVVPTMAAIIGSPGTWYRDPVSGIAWEHMLHSEQDLQLFASLPTAGTLIGRNRVHALHDRGTGKGALMGIERDIVDREGCILARARRIDVLRVDGGFAATDTQNDPRPERLPELPEDMGPAAAAVDLDLLPQAALIYRLSSDRNPLHVDPAVARRAGFERPVMHGLGTFGLAACAVLRVCCGWDPVRLRRLAVRFSSPAFPGDTLRVSFWPTGPGRFAMRAEAINRSARILDNGIVEVASPSTATPPLRSV